MTTRTCDSYISDNLASMKPRSNQHLLVCSDIEAWKENNSTFLDRKFADGMHAYTERWQGRVTCLLKISQGGQPAFGLVDSKSINTFQTMTYLEQNDLENIDFAQFDLALLPSDNFMQIKPIAKKLSKLKIPTAFMIEYSLKTRFFTETYALKNPLHRARRHMYLLAEEIERKLSLRRAAGVQANGIPASKNYGGNQNTICYFDTRARKSDLISIPELELRLTKARNNNIIRLAFSGRLSKIKGIDHLMEVAYKLKKNNLPFSLDIFGDGDHRNWVVDFINKNNLNNEVTVHGAKDFYDELIPFMKNKIDIFIALHPQGDPSCTYLETFTCGVPIIGFNNEAFVGLVKRSNAGIATPIGKTEKVYEEIKKLASDNEKLKQLSHNALEFASKHTMEKTFTRRVKHLQSIVH